MTNLRKKFIFKNNIDNTKYETSYKTIKKIFKDENMSKSDMIHKINKKISRFDTIKAGVDSFLFNNEINIL